VLTNLIHNACDAMSKGGHMTLSTGVQDGRCFFRVADTGTGIPPEIQSRVFDPFFTTKGVKGTGLGLSVSYGIVQRHHGELELQSTMGRGTTFTVWLRTADTGQTHAVLSNPPAPVVRVGGGRILVIDDEESIRDVLADMLRAADHYVETAHDGPSGLKRLDEVMPLDVVFTDLGMPGMSGWEVASAVKQRHPQLPVGLITGWGSTLDAEKMRAHGVDLVVPKPFRFDQVTGVVAAAMSTARARSKG
jgi:CheY-like chemotaxis protein